MTKRNRERLKRIKAICKEEGLTIINPSIWFDEDDEPEDSHVIFNAYSNDYGATYLFHINWGSPFFYASKQYLSWAEIKKADDVTEWFKELEDCND